MPPVKKLEDQNDVVLTSMYPYAKWKFEKFNPVQSRIMDFYDQDASAIISAATSAGKTVIAEQFIAHEVRKRGGKAMFLCPLRALAREKINDWTSKNHHFSDLKISICTGDYRLTKDRINELNEADIIIMTSEMLNHRSRNFKSEKNNWLKNINTVCVDESHLLTVPGRGDHLETGLMKFTEINPKARLVLLSATMPNVDQIADWVSYSLTKKKTYLLSSKYRPVPLSIHYEAYDDESNRYDVLEEEKINKALDIVEWYKNDKFLIFAHTKRTGERMKQSLKQIGIQVEFHNADLEGAKRAEVEDRFRNDSTLRVMIATSTVAWGCYAKGTPVLMANDTIKKIEDICIGDHVYGMTDQGFQSFPVTMVGPKEVENSLRFDLVSGESVVVSADHKFYGATERNAPDYYEASKFGVGDYIAVPAELPQNKIILADDLGYLFGYVMGDGSKCKCGSFKDKEDKIVLDIAFGSSEMQHIQIVKDLFKKVFPEFNFSKERLDVNGVYHLVSKNRALVSNFNMLPTGRNKQNLNLLDLPRNDKSFIKGVIQGLFDTDGGFSSHGNGYTSLEFTTISPILATQVQQYLLFFGVRSFVGKKKVKDSIINGRLQVAKRKFIYRVRIYGKQVSNFLKYIGFRNENKRLYGEYFLSHAIKGEEKNIIPVRALLRDHAKVNNISFNELCKSANIDSWNVLNKSDIKKETLDKILEIYPQQSNLNLLKSKNIRFSKIKKIEFVGFQQMFDIAVDSVQNYVGGGVVSHNCNFPARRVVILGVHRGLQEVESYDILQMVGRSGRLGIDPAGDAYILVPESQSDMYRAKYSKPSRIESQLLEKVGDRYKSLAFHVVSEIHHGEIETTDDVYAWYKRSFAYFQNKELDEDIIKSTLESLQKYGAIWHEDDKWTCRPIGKISSMFYYSPYDVSELFYNFKNLFESNLQSNDYQVAVALANIDSHRAGIISKLEKEEISTFTKKVYALGLKKPVKDAAMKIAYCYYNLLNSLPSQTLAAQQRNLQADFLRVSQVLQALDSFTTGFNKDGFFKTLEGRVLNGVPAHLVDLCQLPNIGKVRARKLYEHGIKTINDLNKMPETDIKKILNMKQSALAEILAEAKKKI